MPHHHMVCLILKIKRERDRIMYKILYWEKESIQKPPKKINVCSLVLEMQTRYGGAYGGI